MSERWSRVFTVYIVVYALLSGYGLYQIKLVERLLPPDLHACIGFLCYGFGFLMWMYLLKKVDLSLAYPVATGALMIVTQLLGIFFLGEKISLQKAAGVAVTLIGIVILVTIKEKG